MEYKNTTFTVYPGYDHVFISLLLDIEKEHNCVVKKRIFKSKVIEELWNKILRHPSINKCFNSFFNKLTSPFLDINYDRNVFVFSNIAIQFIPDKIILKIKKNGGKSILYFLDDSTNINSYIALEKAKKNLFDLVYTFDKKDSLNYGFHHMYSTYSKIGEENESIKYDLCFVGSDKGRFPIIKSIYEKALSYTNPNHLFFSIFQTSIENEKMFPYMIFNESIDYFELIKIVQLSNCILDIVIGEQNGLSLRAYEAVVYNKKLLTNNRSIFEFEFYDSRYMKYFDNINEIDWNFIYSQEYVDYGYNGEFSPIEFLKRICKMIDSY